MFKKLVFAVFLVFGVSSFATSDQEGSSEVPVQEMTEMADMSDDAGGFSGSVELKYTNDTIGQDEVKVGSLTYRARAGWTGTVNESIKWGVGLSSDIEEKFSGYVPKGVSLEQAYVKYSPMDNLSIKAGKTANKWHNYNVHGVMVDDDIYAEGVSAKFHNELNDDVKVYVKAAAVYNGRAAAVAAGSDSKAVVGDIGVPFKKRSYGAG